MAAQALAGRPSFCWLRSRPLAAGYPCFGCWLPRLWLVAEQAFRWWRDRLWPADHRGSWDVSAVRDWRWLGISQVVHQPCPSPDSPRTRRHQTTSARNMVGLGCKAPRQGGRPNWRLFRGSLNLSSGRCPNLVQESLLNSALAWRLALRPPCSDGAAGAGPSRGPLPRRPAVAVREPDKRFDTCWRR